MDWLLSEEQMNLQREAIKFARSALSGDMIERDRRDGFDREGWQRCAEFGLLRAPIPKEHGGMGLGLSGTIALMEGLGYGARDLGLLFSLNAHLWTNSIPIVLHGTEEQRRKYLEPLSDGTLIGANGASEPDAGSDVFAMRTRAERRGDHYVLNGAKTFVTNAPVAGLFVVYATLDPSLGPMGVTAFLVERGTPGLHVGKELKKMGLRTSPMAEVHFDECRVPAANRLGREGRGVEVFECSMEWERGAILASCLGVLRRQLEACVAHARQRKQFGQSIGKFQSVANLIVDMKVRIEACRPLVYRIGQLKDRNQPSFMESAIAKLHVSESYVQSSIDAVRVFGGYGYMVEQEVERDLRDAMGSLLYSGTSEIQRAIIARCLGL
ncbi:acyl-CoA dehydrogenase family protein [Sorangium sp. So ce1036]|uniref:acyl-CoA dehydrogenase family protein n=1 Tax=Sorangium sp. So ce1036 TaxID=3133328 RepID=UPI003F04EE9F